MSPANHSRRAVLAATAIVMALAGTSRAAAQDPSASPDAGGLTLVALPEAPAREGGPLVVVTTTPILADLVRQIGGVRVEVESLLPANADPHDFEPAPADIVSLEGAELVVQHGLGLDPWAADLIDSAGTDLVIVATTGVPTRPADEEGFSDGDPHVWLDPTNVKLMVATLAGALSAIDSAGAQAYEARLAAYHQQLDALDGWIAAEIATIPPERRKLVTNHASFGYYAARYGLTFVGSVIPSIDSRAEPSAKEISELIETIKREGVPAIFTEASLNPELERELAAQAGVSVVPNLYSDSFGEAGSGADTYIGLMVTDTRLIVDALR